MKTILSISFLLFAFTGTLNAQSQAVQLSERIAVKMKDSLGLTAQQKGRVYSVNMRLHTQKAAVRQEYTNVDSLTFYTQKIENKRDSLYRLVLTEQQFLLYRQKKRRLVNSN